MTKRDASGPPTEAEADYCEAEVARRRDEVVRRMLKTPHKPQEKTRAPNAKKRRKTPAKA